MTHHVYTFWAGTEPLYTGCTGNLPRRMREHESRLFSDSATHVSVIPFDDAAEAFAAEERLIRDLRPRCNVRGNPAHRCLEDVLPDDRPPTVRERKREALRALFRRADVEALAADRERESA